MKISTTLAPLYITIICLQLMSCNPVQSDLVALAGDDKVLIVDMGKSNEQDVAVIWSWTEEDTREHLPESYVKYFQSMDDCKPVNGGKGLLICSSSWGVLYVDIESKKPLFYTLCPNAHSVELLPNDRIAVALSTNSKGNALEIYDVDRPEAPIFRDSLYSGHGVVWNQERQRLYALGYSDLREYSLQEWEGDKASLKLERSWDIPGKGGHDLSFVNNNELLITEHYSVWKFDIQKEEFTPFEALENVRNLKSVNYNPESGRIIYTKAEESWWTFNIYSINPDKKINIPSIRIYKTRTF